MKNKILLIILCLIIFNPINVSSLQQTLINQYTYEDIKENNIKKSDDKSSTKKLSIFGALKYRLVEKDTKDFWDYVILIILIVGLLIVMVFQNTHYYIVKIPEKETKKKKNNNIKLTNKTENHKQFYKKKDT